MANEVTLERRLHRELDLRSAAVDRGCVFCVEQTAVSFIPISLSSFLEKQKKKVRAPLRAKESLAHPSSVLHSFCSISGFEERTEWSNNAGRIEHREEIEANIQDWIQHHNRKDLEAMLAGIPCAPINTVSEALADPQSEARGALLTENEVTTLASPLRFMDVQNND